MPKKKEFNLEEKIKTQDNEYIKLLNIEELKKLFKDGWQSKLLNIYDVSSSSIWRYANPYNVKYLVDFKFTEYATTSISITRSYKSMQINCNYCFIYSTIQNNTINSEFICIDGTYKSADGEFRKNFTPYKQLFKIYNENIDVIEPIENYVIELLKNSCIIKTVTRFSESTKFKTKKGGGAYDHKLDYMKKTKSETKKYINDWVNKNRLPIITYTMLFIMECHRHNVHINSTHMTPGYDLIVCNPEDLKFYRSLGKENLEKYMNIYIRMTHLETSNVPITALGQKILPIRTKEMIHFEDVHYPIWKELYINRIAQNLVFNNILFGIPYHAGFFLINGNDKDMYDNKTNQDKIDHSEVAKRAVLQLQAARQYTFSNDNINKSEMYHSYKFNEFDDEIKIPIDYAERNLIMSNYSVCVISEVAGRTFGDLPNLVFNEKYAESLGPMFRDVTCFSRYMFEYVYNLYCLNVHCGVIHGDLHANNITMYGKFVFDPDKTRKIIYKVKDVCYMFDHFGKFACIIDFSRSILNRESLAKLKLTEEIYTDDDILDIIKKQNKTILQKYEAGLPEYYKENAIRLADALEKVPDSFFKLFTAYDVFHMSYAIKMTITRVMENMVGVEKVIDRSIVEASLFPLLDKMRYAAQEVLTVKMSELLNNLRDDYVKDYPIPGILDSVFKRFRMDVCESPFGQMEKTDIAFSDYFNSDKKMTMFLEDEKTYPDFMKLVDDGDTRPAHAARMETYAAYKAYKKTEKPEEKLWNIVGRYIEKNKPNMEEIRKVMRATDEIEKHFETTTTSEL